MISLKEYHQNIIDASPFFDRINFNLKDDLADIPSFNMINYDLLNKNLRLKKRMLIILPNLYYTHYWAGLLLAINEINNTLKNYDIYDKYEPRQKLLFNDKHIVEFQSFLENGGIAVKTSDSRYIISEEFKTQEIT